MAGPGFRWSRSPPLGYEFGPAPPVGTAGPKRRRPVETGPIRFRRPAAVAATVERRLKRLADIILDTVVLPGKIVGWLVLPLILSVLLTVFAAKMGWNAFWRWEEAIPVLGTGITVNTLADLQWYIFAILAVLGGVYALRDDQHVSVDVFVAGLPRRARLALTLFGDLVFLLPFCIIIVWYGWKFALTSFASGEGSTYGGLMDRWLIKAVVPAGFALLGLAAIARVLRTLALLTGQADNHETAGTHD